MYMCRLRYINDPVLSSLKMEGILLLFLKDNAMSLGQAVLNIFNDRSAFVGLLGTTTNLLYFTQMTTQYTNSTGQWTYLFSWNVARR
jgi:hypothetical protein